MTENKTCCLNNNSLIPAIKESERFIKFLDKKFNLNLPNNFLITINKARKSAIGFFMPKEHPEHFTNTTQDLNNINLNTYHLKQNSPFEVLAHELAHFLNHIKKVKDCTINQHHNKHFKKQAESLFLSVEKTNKGYAQTTETQKFKQILKEFNPDKDAFNIFQNQKEKKKVGSRLLLYECSCGIKVRCSLSVSLKAICQYCDTEFKRV